MINRKPTLANAAKATLAAALTLSAFACHSNSKPAQQAQNQVNSKQSPTSGGAGGNGSVPAAQQGMQIDKFAIDTRFENRPNLIAYSVEFNGQSIPLSNVLLEADSTFTRTFGDVTYVGASKCANEGCTKIGVFVTATPAKSSQSYEAAALFGQDEKGNWTVLQTSPADAQYGSVDDAMESLNAAELEKEYDGVEKSAAPAPTPTPTPTPAVKAAPSVTPEAKAASVSGASKAGLGS